MNESTSTVGKLMSKASIKRTSVNPNKEVKRKTAQELGCPSSNTKNSPPRKKKPSVTNDNVDSSHSFQETAAGAGAELGTLLSTWADMLSERAAADSLQMNELQGVLTQAQKLEAHLQDKKSQLKQTLALIADKLQE